MKQVLLVQSRPRHLLELESEITEHGIRRLEGFEQEINALFPLVSIPGQENLLKAFYNRHIANGRHFWDIKNSWPRKSFGTWQMMQELVTEEVYKNADGSSLYEAVKRTIDFNTYVAAASECYMTLIQLFTKTLDRHFICLAFVSEPFFSMIADCHLDYSVDLAPSKPLSVWHYFWDEYEQTDPDDPAGYLVNAKYYG